MHGPSIFAVKAKIHGVLHKQSSSIAFDETSSYCHCIFFFVFLHANEAGHKVRILFLRVDRNCKNRQIIKTVGLALPERVARYHKLFSVLPYSDPEKHRQPCSLSTFNNSVMLFTERIFASGKHTAIIKLTVKVKIRF